jgi:uncharacterized membrane protein
MRMTPTADNGQPCSGMAEVVERNIRALLARRRTEDEQASWQDRLAARITSFTGSMRFVYLHLAIYGLWIVANLPGVPLPHFDPTYVILAMAASVEAIFLSTFILITQNRNDCPSRDARRPEPAGQFAGRARDHPPDHPGDGDRRADGD